MTWVGSVITAVAFLSWLALDFVESVPTLLNLTAILVLALMIYIVIRYADSLHPFGIGGPLRKASGSEGKSQSPQVIASYLKANLSLERERAFWVVFGDWLANVPLLIVFLEAGFTTPAVGLLAALIAVMRIAIGAGWLSVIIVIARPGMLDTYVRSTTQAEEMIRGSTKITLFFFKLSRVGRLIGATLKTLFYGTQIVGVSLLYVYYVGPNWAAIRLAAISLGVGFLAVFAYNAWYPGVRTVRSGNWRRKGAEQNGLRRLPYTTAGCGGFNRFDLGNRSTEILSSCRSYRRHGSDNWIPPRGLVQRATIWTGALIPALSVHRSRHEMDEQFNYQVQFPGLA